MKYETAFDFWRDLKIQFGNDAKRIAFEYLDIITAQSRKHGDDPDELAFCKDLFSCASAE